MRECKNLRKLVTSYLKERNPSFKKTSHKLLELLKKEIKCEYGFVGYVEEKTGHLIIPTLSRKVVEKCNVKDSPMEFSSLDNLHGYVIKKGEPFLSNDFKRDIKSPKFPQGHVELKNLIMIPALMNKKTIGLVALANKKTDFDKNDLSVAQAFANFYAMIVYNLVNVIQREEENSYFKQLVENSRDIVYVIDSSGRIEYMNKRYKDYGYEAKDVIGHKVSEFAHPEDLNLVMGKLVKAFETGKTSDLLRFRVLKKDGSFFYADQTSSVIFKNRRPNRIVAAIRDCDSERRLEEKIKRQRKILDNIYELSPDMIFIKDLEGRYINANKACSDFMKKSRKALLGKTDFDLFSNLADQIKEDEKKVFKGETVNSVYQWGKKTVNTVKTPIRNDKGEIEFMLAIARDITQIKKMENQLAILGLREKIKKITGDLSHDINNTLSVMSGYASIISESKDVEKEEKKNLKIIDKSIRKAAKIVRLYRKKIDSGKL